MQHEVIEAQSRILGADHPKTLTTASDLAVSLSGQGSCAEAEQMLREVLDTDLSSLPPERRAFRAGRSMRDVEPPVDLYLHELED
jgi:hypothetical protein